MQKLSGELQKHKKIRNHLFQSISEVGEAAVFGQKRQSSDGSIHSCEAFPRHIQ